MHTEPLTNFINGQWHGASGSEYQDVLNPATGEVLAQVPLSDASDVLAAVDAASAAFLEWRRTPPEDRIQPLFKLKQLMEDHFEEFGRLITQENGKTLAEAKGEMRRAIENVEVACGIPIMMQGYNLEDVARGIDETMIRQPLGVVAAITPFNFPGMIPFWFLPYAIACGNTLILKPSERVPLTMRFAFDLLQRTGLPKGVVNLVNGGKKVVDALLDHPQIRAISFVGSTPVAKYVYARAAANGKRAQCQGGAKNHVIVLPDADMSLATQIISDSAFGCAGQRCLAVSVAVTVGDAQKVFGRSITEAAAKLKVGNGLEASVQVGPQVNAAQIETSKRYVEIAVSEGAQLLTGGHALTEGPYAHGSFFAPTVLGGVMPSMRIAREEVFGPVVCLIEFDIFEQAVEVANSIDYGLSTALYTKDVNRAFTAMRDLEAGITYINAPTIGAEVHLPFGGVKHTGNGHREGLGAIDFFTTWKAVYVDYSDKLQRAQIDNAD